MRVNALAFEKLTFAYYYLPISLEVRTVNSNNRVTAAAVIVAEAAVIQLLQ